MRSTAIALTLGLLCLACDRPSPEYYGSYSGPVRTEWLDEREMRLLDDFSFEDPNGMTWHAPQGSVIDGASIPKALWTMVGSPFAGKYRNASVIHDVACEERARTWEAVHLAFYYGMRASGVPERQAKIMYAGVYHFGPRWSPPGSSTSTGSPDIAYRMGPPEQVDDERQARKAHTAAQEESEIAALRELIEGRIDSGEELSLEQIRSLRP